MDADIQAFFDTLIESVSLPPEAVRGKLAALNGKTEGETSYAVLVTDHELVVQPLDDAGKLRETVVRLSPATVADVEIESLPEGLFKKRLKNYADAETIQIMIDLKDGDWYEMRLPGPKSSAAKLIGITDSQAEGLIALEQWKQQL
jgi:hypothetical protein